METNADVCWAPTADRRQEEQRLISSLVLPLNIEGNNGRQKKWLVGFSYQFPDTKRKGRLDFLLSSWRSRER